jgi:hypothetical protein
MTRRETTATISLNPRPPPLLRMVRLPVLLRKRTTHLLLRRLLTVTEYMNAEWWKGRSSRTGQVGIFPRSYVKVDEKAPAAGTTNNYGNEPLAVSGESRFCLFNMQHRNYANKISGMGNGEGKAPSKIEENGKKFGKKLGNATIFGAGATIGGNLVNSIF